MKNILTNTKEARKATVVEIIKKDWQETNPHANPRFNCNGGGYSQPEGWMIVRIFDRYVMIKYRDSSCGDFGSREYLEIVSGSDDFQFNFGSMDDASNEMSRIEDFINTKKGQAFEKAFGLNIAEFYYAIF